MAQGLFCLDPDQGLFLETFERGSFGRATTGADPVELRVDHREVPAYASTTQKSLKVVDEPNGLLLAAALAKSNPANQALVQSIKDGTRTGLSVGFRATADKWGVAPDRRTAMRTIYEAHLTEVSVVRVPANPGAKILDVRHETRSADGIEYRSFPLVYRQELDSPMQYPEPDGDDGPCTACNGTGRTPDGQLACPSCGGSGRVTSDDDADDRSYASSVAVDATRTHAHLLDTILSNQAHAMRHHERLSDADVRSSKKQVDFHVSHLGAHLAEVQDHALKLDNSLSKTTHNPAQYVAERKALKEKRKEPTSDMLDRLRFEDLRDDAELDRIRAGMPDRGQQVEIDNENEDLTVPPRLKHGTIQRNCGNCAASMNSKFGGILRCAMYDDYLVRVDQVCSSWTDVAPRG